MKLTRNDIISFLITLFGCLLIILCVHLIILNTMDYKLTSHLILQAYFSNFILGVIIYVTILVAPEKYTNSLGFIFLGGSMLKFAVFLLFFSPVYRSDGNIDRVEFLAFFIPYVTALIVETKSLIKKLQQ